MSNFRFLKYGAPLFILVVGAPFALKEFQQLKFDFGQNQRINREEMRKMGIKVKEKENVTLESVFDRVKEIDTDNWENKRGPRPWEEGNELYQEAVERKLRIETEKKSVGKL